MGARTSVYVALLLSALPSRAGALEWDGFASARFFRRSIPDEVLRSRLRTPATSSSVTSDLTSLQLAASGSVRGRPVDVVGLELGLDTGLIEIDGREVRGNGRPIGEHLKETLLLGETFAELQLFEDGALLLRAGKLRPRIGGGAIFDAYAFGVLADLDTTLGEDPSGWRARAQALLPDGTFSGDGKKSPLIDAEVAYAFGHDAEVRLFGALFVDGQDGLDPVLSDAVLRTRTRELFDSEGRSRPILTRAVMEAAARGDLSFVVKTKGWLGWIGLAARWADGPFSLRAQGIFGTGHIQATAAPSSPQLALLDRLPALGRRDPALRALAETRTDDVSVLSGFGEASFGVQLGGPLHLSLFGLAASGDEGFSRAEQGSTYKSFISLAPRLGYTDIFFDGGISSLLGSPIVVSIAPDGAGLFAGGLEALLTPHEDLQLRATAGVMWAGASAERRLYGVEANLGVAWAVAGPVTLTADGGVFVPGGYYGDLPAGYQVIAAVEVAP